MQNETWNKKKQTDDGHTETTNCNHYTKSLERQTYNIGELLMNPEIILRPETKSDINLITDLTTKAFKTLEISNHTEQFIILALRAANVLTLSIVAELNEKIVGHIAFSPVSISDGTKNWYGLGPVSVLPEYQKQGIGTVLIENGLSKLKSFNAQGCCLVGHPEYYIKFGFRNISSLFIDGVPPEVFFALSFDGNFPKGSVTFHKAFTAEK